MILEPDENKIKSLLLECLEIHYGNLSEAVVVSGKAEETIRRIKELVQDI